MNTFRYDQDQRQAWVLDKLNGAKSVKRICREAAISRATLYNWIEEFPGQKDAARKIKAEEALALPVSALSAPEISLKKSSAGRYEMLLKALTQADASGAVRKKLVQILVKRFTLTVAAACELAALDEAAYGYRPRKPEEDDRLVYEAISAVLEEDNTRNFEACCRVLQVANPGWPRKQIKRLWGEKKLYQQRARNRKQAMAIVPQAATRLRRPGASWRIGYATLSNEGFLFITDEADGATLNARLVPGGASTAEDVISLCAVALTENGAPRKIILAAKAPFNSRDITVWVWEQKIALQMLSMGKPENEATFTQMEAEACAALQASAAGKNGAAIAEAWISYAPSGIAAATF